MGKYIILIGVQGAGKGEQSKFMSREYDIPHISTGNLFRAMQNRTDDFALEIQEIMKSGKFVSDENTNRVLLDRLSNSDAQSGFILDGYPRNIAQAQWLENYLQNKGEKLTVVLLLELDLYIAFKRTFGRVSSPEGDSYNIYYNNNGLEYKRIKYPHGDFFPPRLEAIILKTKTPLIRRSDDSDASAVIERIDKYITETRPLVEYYSQQGLLYVIEAEKSIDDVHLEIMLAIEAAGKKG